MELREKWINRNLRERGASGGEKVSLKQKYIKGQREVVTNWLNDTEKYNNIRNKNVFIGFGN